MAQTDTSLKADLVLEGGGVKGIALAGALKVLEDAGYTFPRVAGTSAGAIIGALVAAGVGADDLHTIMLDTDFKEFMDEGSVQKYAGPVGTAYGLWFKQGVYRGDYFLDYLRNLLDDAGVDTFDQLEVDSDDNASLPIEARHRLVVMASDIRRNELVRLPWDLQSVYGVDPDDLSVASAVRASMAIPFFFRPFYIRRNGAKGRGSRHTLVDGGMLSNFPIDVFDRKDASPPRWPTFGLKLSARVEDKTPEGSQDVDGSVAQVKAMITTMTSFHDSLHVGTPAVIDRTIFIDNLGVSSVNFDLDRDTQDRLYESGRDAATKFLESWDFDAYVAKYRTD
ncbi:MAG: patatin-like phospholipase family protein [Acidimicrobiia bacterium]|nr:patatin-like phospholipase family protein [Acidimicrobiia bacterium]